MKDPRAIVPHFEVERKTRMVFFFFFFFWQISLLNIILIIFIVFVSETGAKLDFCTLNWYNYRCTFI